VTGQQRLVFLVRLADTTLAVGVAVAALAMGATFQAVPFALAVSSLLGGVALRWIAARGEPTASRG
jgi:hypothetical protein